VRWIAEEHPVQDVTDLQDGRLRVTLAVADERWLVRLLLRTGPAVAVLDRPDIVAAVREEAQAALAGYASLD
jgi:proteasome accessory factor C